MVKVVQSHQKCGKKRSTKGKPAFIHLWRQITNYSLRKDLRQNGPKMLWFLTAFQICVRVYILVYTSIYCQSILICLETNHPHQGFSTGGHWPAIESAGCWLGSHKFQIYLWWLIANGNLCFNEIAKGWLKSPNLSSFLLNRKFIVELGATGVEKFVKMGHKP